MDIRNFIPLGQTPDPMNMRPDDDAFLNPLQQMAQGVEQTFAPLAQQGLGLAKSVGQGVADLMPSAETAQNGLYRLFAGLEAAGASGRGQTPLYLQQQAQQQELAMKRQQLAQQLEQQKESQRQHDMQNVISILTKDGMTDAQREIALWPIAQRNPLVKNIIDGIGKKRLGKVKQYAEEFPDEMADLAERAQNGAIGSEDIDETLSMLDTRRKQRAKARAEASEYKRLSELAEKSLQTGEPMDPGDQEMFIQLQQAQAKRQLELDKLRAEIEAKRMQTEKTDDPKVTQMAEEISAELFDKPWKELNQQQRAAVGKEKERRIQGRTSTMIQQGLPVGLEKQANYYTRRGLDNLELEQAPSGLTKQQYDTGPYRELDAKETAALTEYKIARKTVDTMNKVADKLITANSPGAALKQKIALEAGAFSGRNGLAAAYKRDMDAFASRMARLVEVGVLTNVDVTRWSDTFGQFGDTRQTLKAKQALFAEIQDETERLLKLRLGGKPITTTERSKLDLLLDKTDKFRSVDKDFDTLMGGKK